MMTVKASSRRVYPSEFVARVKKAFPSDKSLHFDLDHNKEHYVGRFLYEEAEEATLFFSANQVLDALNGGLDDVIKLREEAERKLELRSLSEEWCAITEAWYDQAN